MPQIINYEGQDHEFPDDFTDQDISRALSSHDQEMKVNKIKEMDQNGPLGMLGNASKDISGGILNSAVGAGKMAVDVAKSVMPTNALNNVGNLVPQGIKDKIPSMPNIDPYKLMGTEEKSITTPGGMLQTAGELMAPGMAASKGAKGILEAVKKLRTKNIAKNIIEQKNSVKKEYNELYTKLFDEAKKRGLGQTEIEVPELNHKFIMKNTTPRYHKSLAEFTESPTIENAQKAQSDLGKLINKLEGIDTSSVNSLTSSERKVLQTAKETQKKIKDKMFKGEVAGEHPDLANTYEEINKGYKENVIPYTKNKAIRSYQNKELSESKLIKRLKNNDAFMINRGHAHKDIIMRDRLIKGIGAGGVGAAGYYGAQSILKKLLGTGE